MSRPSLTFQGTIYRNDSLQPVVVALEKDNVIRPVVLQAGQEIDLKQGVFAGYDLKVTSANTQGPRGILDQIAILDTETIGKGRGSQITELAVAKDLFSETKAPTLDVMLVKPDLMVMSEIMDEGTDRIKKIDFFERLSVKAPDLFQGPNASIKNFEDVQYLNLLSKPETVRTLRSTQGIFNTLSDADRNAVIQSLENVSKNRNASTIAAVGRNLEKIKQDPVAVTALQEIFKTTERFQARYYFDDLVKEFPAEVQERLAYLKGRNVTEKQVRDLLKLSRQYVDIDFDRVKINLDQIRSNQIVDKLQQSLNGRITFIANAAFEAKQVGAELRASIFEEVERIAQPGESKQKLFDQVLRSRLEAGQSLSTATKVSTLTGEPFYVSGREYVTQRLEAFRQQDFSFLNRAIIQYAKPGDTVDILDLVRSQQSLLQNMGVLSGKKPLSIGIEVQARLFRASELAAEGDVTGAFDVIRNFKELHLAEADALISERQVTRSAMLQGDVLSQIFLGEKQAAEVDQKLLRQALFYSEFQQTLVDNNIADINTNQRLGRYLTEYGEHGYFSDSNIEGQVLRDNARQFYKDGNKNIEEIIPKAKYKKATFEQYSDLEKLLVQIMDQNKNPNTQLHVSNLRQDLLSRGIIKDIGSGQFAFADDARSKAYVYGSELSETAYKQIEIVEELLKQDPADLERRVSEKLYKLNARASSSVVNKFRTNIVARNPASSNAATAAANAGLNLNVSSATRSNVTDGLGKITNYLDDISDTLTNRAGQLKSFIANNRIGKVAAIAGTGLFAASLFQQHFYPERKSNLLVPSYDDWFESNAEYFGNNESFLRSIRENLQIEGMQEGGFAADLRKAITDFGSPYAGPSYSNSVLDDFKLTRLRNQMVRKSFYETHFAFGHIDQLLKAFTKPIAGYKRETGLVSYYPNTTKIDPEDYQGLKGTNLVKLNLTDGYKLSMEDADTLTIQGGGNSALNKFMGTSKYSFRLAGIDSPETAHDDRPSQPYAEEAKRIASAMIRRAKNVEIVVDPNESTYGRQVAMIYADGRNINLELIKRGAAAYLPYKSKQRENMYNEQAFEKAQELAQNSERGMWRKPYFQAYKDIVKNSGQSVTFNQLANVNTVSKSSSLMSMYSIMNTAQNMGFYSTEAAMNAAQIGSSIGALGNRAFKPDARSSLHHETPASMMKGDSYASEHLDQMNSEIVENMQGRSASRLNNFKSGRFANANRTLAKNSMHVQQSIWNEEKYRIRDIYKVKQRKLNRVLDMQFLQHEALNDLNKSPIGHWRM